jgi:peptidoglycan/xylan/chitin deacetylase (PgdA/CDA1 family)
MRIKIFAAVLCLVLVAVDPLLAAGNEVLILAYHSFLGSGTSSLDFSPAELARQLDDFTALGYRFVTWRDILEGRVEGKQNILVTIDDGNHSVSEAFTHVFAPRGIKPMLFVYPAVIGKMKYALSREDLRTLSDAGCDIGAHGYFHEYLTVNAFATDKAKCLIEIERPAKAISAMIGKPVMAFAYPFSMSSPEAEVLLGKNGFEWAFIAGNALEPVDFSSSSLDHRAIPRTIVYRWNLKSILAEMTRQSKNERMVSR